MAKKCAAQIGDFRRSVSVALNEHFSGQDFEMTECLVTKAATEY